MHSLLRSTTLALVVLLAACARPAETPANTTPAAVIAAPIPYGANAPASGTFTHDGVTLYYETYGDGPPLLLVHGNGGSIGTLAALIDHLKIGAVDVVGWSDGGIEALLLGVRHPTKVKKLVAMAANLNPGAQAIYKETDELVKNMLAAMPESVRNTPQGKREYKVASTMLKEPHIDAKLLRQITAPTLVLAGDHDLVGTSGYNYPEWKGSFYPADLAASKMLPYYASKFKTVEINYTFYRMPTSKIVAGWAAQVPPEFRFTLKAPKRITHDKRLRAAEVADSVRTFVSVAGELGPQLAALLFQLPPNFKKDIVLLNELLDTSQ